MRGYNGLAGSGSTLERTPNNHTAPTCRVETTSIDSALVGVNASFVGGRAEVYLSTSETEAPLARWGVQLGATCSNGEVLPASEHSGWRRSTLLVSPLPEEWPGLVLLCALNEHCFVSQLYPTRGIAIPVHSHCARPTRGVRDRALREHRNERDCYSSLSPSTTGCLAAQRAGQYPATKAAVSASPTACKIMPPGTVIWIVQPNDCLLMTWMSSKASNNPPPTPNTAPMNPR